MQAAFWSLAADGGDSSSADQWLVSTPPLAAQERAAIYADMFIERQLSCLRDDFPKLAQWLGHDAFTTLASAYLSAHPSRHYSLATLGRELPQFLAMSSDAPAAASDLAALEWARAEVFEETDAAVAAAPSAWDRPLRVVPALRLLSLQHDVLALWDALERGLPAPRIAVGAVAIVVWRKQYEVFHVGLAREEAEALQRAAAGEPLADVCSVFAERDDALEAAARALGSWFAEGFIAAD
jgi:hypothetical protein